MNNSGNGCGGNWKRGCRGGGDGEVKANPTGEAQEEEARLGGEAGDSEQHQPGDDRQLLLGHTLSIPGLETVPPRLCTVQ